MPAWSDEQMAAHPLPSLQRARERALNDPRLSALVKASRTLRDIAIEQGHISEDDLIRHAVVLERIAKGDPPASLPAVSDGNIEVVHDHGRMFVPQRDAEAITQTRIEVAIDATRLNGVHLPPGEVGMADRNNGWHSVPALMRFTGAEAHAPAPRALGPAAIAAIYQRCFEAWNTTPTLWEDGLFRDYLAGKIVKAQGGQS